MAAYDDWPEFCPDPQLTVVISSGQLTLGGTSKLLNYRDYTWDPVEVRGTIWKNGNKVATLSIDSSDGDITLSSPLSVATNDPIEIRLQFIGRLSLPWYTKTLMRRSAFLTVPAGDSTFTFDSQNNSMPIPDWDLAFGWDSNDKLKLGFRVNSDDSASQDMSLYTRMLGGAVAKQSSSTIDLDSQSTQTHTSDFTKAEVEVACEAEMWLKSGTGTTRQEDRFRLVLMKLDEVGAYPSNFPTTGIMLEQEKATGTTAAKWIES